MVKEQSPDAFYVGYVPQCPESITRFLRPIILLLIIGAAGLAALLVFAQAAFAPAVFEFGHVRSFEGVIVNAPYPLLVLDRPLAQGANPEEPVRSAYYLVAPMKFGAGGLTADFHLKPVRLKGALVYRDDQTMIEMVPGSIVATGDASQERNPEPPALGTFSLRGEIVDSKCFLGVMNPGNLKAHKACAVRCISGGIPPVLVVRNGAGYASYFLLVGSNGETVNHDVLDMIAQPVEIRGQLFRQDNLLVLKADPASYKKL